MSSTQRVHDDELLSPLPIGGSDIMLNNRKISTSTPPSVASDLAENSTYPEQQQNGNATLMNYTRGTPNTNVGSNARPMAVFLKLKTYLLALRPWSLSASLVPTLLGSALAYRSSTPHEFNLLTFVFTIFTVVTVHGAGNLVNTYFDFRKGIDNRKSDDRTLVDHILSEDEVVRLSGVLYIAGCVGLYLIWTLSPAKWEHLASVYFGGLSSSFLYTGGIGLKYIALGDIIVLIIFGPIAVLFAYFTQTGVLEWSTIYYAIPLALNTEAILHSNNTRDAQNDKAAGIVTLAIIIGRSASHVLYAILLFAPYIAFVVLTLKFSVWFMLPLVTLPQAFKIERLFRSETTLHSVPKQTAKLNFFFGILYVIACCGAPQIPGLSTTVGPH